MSQNSIHTLQRLVSSVVSRRRVQRAPCHRKAILAGVIALGGAVATTVADTTPAFRVRTIGTLPGGTKSWAMDITPTGDVVGYASTIGHTTPHGFFWDHTNSTLSDMGTLSGNPTDESYAYAIAQTGYVCGDSEFGSGANRDAFIWWGPGVGMLPIGPPPPGHAIGSAYDIEFDPGAGLHRAVGFTIDVATSAPHATLWEWELGLCRSLGTLTGNPADWSRAFGVNQFGDVVGMSTRGGLPTHAFIYQNLQMVDIDNRPTGGSSSANSVNNFSQIVGFYEPAATFTATPCRWQLQSVGWTNTDLGCLPGGSPMTASAEAINDGALVVGWSFDPADGNKKACVWLNDQIYDLNTLITGPNSLQLMSAQGVNGAGQIVGYGLDVNGDEQAFVLDPATLLLNTPVPGVAGVTNEFFVNGATPNKTVHVAYSTKSGSTNVPGCPGVVVDLRNPKVIGSPRADATGTAQLRKPVPNGAAGLTVYLQAAEVSSCRVSNRIMFTFN